MGKYKLSSDIISLDESLIGRKYEVIHLNCSGIMRRRFLDLGLIPGCTVQALYKNSANSLTAYLIRGTMIAIRHEDASTIMIKEILT